MIIIIDNSGIIIMYVVYVIYRVIMCYNFNYRLLYGTTLPNHILKSIYTTLCTCISTIQQFQAFYKISQKKISQKK